MALIPKFPVCHNYTQIPSQKLYQSWPECPYKSSFCCFVKFVSTKNKATYLAFSPPNIQTLQTHLPTFHLDQKKSNKVNEALEEAVPLQHPLKIHIWSHGIFSFISWENSLSNSMLSFLWVCWWRWVSSYPCSLCCGNDPHHFTIQDDLPCMDTTSLPFFPLLFSSYIHVHKTMKLRQFLVQ